MTYLLLTLNINSWASKKVIGGVYVISRWIEAMKVQKAPPIVLESCHEAALEFISLQELRKYTYQ